MVGCACRIVGKYGGVPALGPMVLPSAPRQAHLKASGNSVAREIYCSTVEGRDAGQLAQVMRFHDNSPATHQQPGTFAASDPSIPSSHAVLCMTVSDAQAAVYRRYMLQCMYCMCSLLLGYSQLTACDVIISCSVAVASTFLAGARDWQQDLRSRSGPLSHRAAAAPREPAAASSTQTDELSTALSRRQAALQAMEASAANGAGTSTSGPSSSSTITPELAARLQHRAQPPSDAPGPSARRADVARSASVPGPPAVGAISDELAEKLRRRQAANGEQQ